MKVLLVIFLSCLTLAAAYLGFRLHRNSLQDKEIKSDYFRANQIKYGMLSGNNWSYQVNRILVQKIDSFSFDAGNKQVLTKQVNRLLERMLEQANEMLHRERKELKDKIKYKLINAFIDIDEFRPEIPKFTAAIIDEVSKPGNRDKLKTLLREKVSGFLAATNQDSIGERASVIRKYGAKDLHGLNALVEVKTGKIRDEQKMLGYLLIGILCAVLLVWVWLLRIKKYFGLAFVFSVLISFTALFTGISLPMIEIDARISELKLELLSSHIVFYDQVIFYQAKSILDVVHILITNGKADMVFVGCLIFAFSVLFPVAKLICTTIFLFAPKRGNRFITYMAFKSGKWSMADVMVISIFMAYVGFKGILDNQLSDIDMHTETINVITTNKTNLQTGFIIFVAFCLFNLILAAILSKITTDRQTTAS